jgi:hypothetical protein
MDEFLRGRMRGRGKGTLVPTHAGLKCGRMWIGLMGRWKLESEVGFILSNDTILIT